MSLSMLTPVSGSHQSLYQAPGYIPHKSTRVEPVGRLRHSQGHSLADHLINNPLGFWQGLSGHEKEWLAISILRTSRYGVHQAFQGAKGRRLVQFLPVSRTYFTFSFHLSFLICPELCGPKAQCSFQATFRTIARFREPQVMFSINM